MAHVRATALVAPAVVRALAAVGVQAVGVPRPVRGGNPGALVAPGAARAVGEAGA